MAHSTIPQPAPRLHTRPGEPPSPAEVLAFCEAGHTNHEAAERWHISERYVRKLKARARTLPRVEDRLASVVAPVSHDNGTTSPTFPETNGADVAGDHTMWKDPWTGELLSPPPGAIRRAWEAERRAAQARHSAAIMLTEAAQDRPVTHSNIMNSTEQDRPAEQPPSASASEVPARNSEETPAAQVRPDPPVQVITRVIRVPVEPPASPIVAWLKDHAPPVQLVTAIVAFLFLVALTWIG